MSKAKGLLLAVAAAAMAFTFSCSSGGGSGDDGGFYNPGGNTASGTYTGYDSDGKEYKLAITKAATNPDPGGGGNSALNGTWVNSSASNLEMTLNNGNFETTISGRLNNKGTYATNGNNIKFTTTHVHGDIQGLELRWYSEAEWEAMGKSTANWDQSTGTYSISGNTLTLTFDNGIQTWTRSGGGGAGRVAAKSVSAAADAPQSGDAYVLTWNGKTSTGTIAVSGNGATFTLTSPKGSGTLTVTVSGSGIVSITKTGIFNWDDNSTFTPPGTLSTTKPGNNQGGDDGNGWPPNSLLTEFGLTGLSAPAGATSINYLVLRTPTTAGSISYDGTLMINFNVSSTNDNAIKNYFTSNGWESYTETETMHSFKKTNFMAVYLRNTANNERAITSYKNYSDGVNTGGGDDDGKLTINGLPSGGDWLVSVFAAGTNVSTLADFISASMESNNKLQAGGEDPSSNVFSLIVNNGSGTTWTGSGSRVVVLIDQDDEDSYYYATVSFSNGSATVVFSNFTAVRF